MKLLARICLSLFLLIIGGCAQDSGNSRIEIFYINHYKAECHGLELRLCLQTRRNQNDEWTFFHSAIAGFDYEWGYAYKIEVDTETIINPPQDSSSKRYTLLNVIEKVKEPTTSIFDISVSRAGALINIATANHYEMYADKKIMCLDADCAIIESLLVQDLAILFEFRHQLDSPGPLIVSQIKCSSSRDTFRDACL